MAVNFAYTLKHICMCRRKEGEVVVMAIVLVGVKLLLIIDYIYDVNSSSGSNIEFRINDNVLSTLILASSCIREDSLYKIAGNRKIVADIHHCLTHGSCHFSGLKVVTKC
jgi:hypothetical protein